MCALRMAKLASLHILTKLRQSWGDLANLPIWYHPADHLGRSHQADTGSPELLLGLLDWSSVLPL